MQYILGGGLHTRTFFYRKKKEKKESFFVFCFLLKREIKTDKQWEQAYVAKMFIKKSKLSSSSLQ